MKFSQVSYSLAFWFNTIKNKHTYKSHQNLTISRLIREEQLYIKIKLFNAQSDILHLRLSSFAIMITHLTCCLYFIDSFLRLFLLFTEYRWQFKLVMLLSKIILNCLHFHFSNLNWTLHTFLLLLFICLTLIIERVCLLLKLKTIARRFLMLIPEWKVLRFPVDRASPNLSNETTDDF